MDLKNLKKFFIENRCRKIYVKKLSCNDNSKNQVYLGGSFEILNILPVSDIVTESAGDWKRERFKASMRFYWMNDEGNLYHAPKSQLILYPKYPEVRFSGFLAKCEQPPSELMTHRIERRLLFLSVTNTGTVIGYVASPDSQIALEFEHEAILSDFGVFKIIELPESINNKERLILELRRIHLLNWITSKRLNANREVLSCLSPNCGGYTLEAELGITPNGYSEPDYLGWEIKQFGVSNFDRISSKVITLMTPEPTHGIYADCGAEAFVRSYGYEDLKGRIDRLNFGGIHKVSERHPRTNLKMELIGFDSESGKIRSSDGMIALVDINDKIAASWSFSSLLLHWNRKHNQACYVPSLSEKEPIQRYKYGQNVILGEGTDFQMFLKEMSLGHIFYDPGIKLEDASTSPKIKKRSQFRIKAQYLKELYKHNEIVSVLE